MNAKRKKSAAAFLGPFAKTTTIPSLGETLAHSQAINLAAVDSNLKARLGGVQNEAHHTIWLNSQESLPPPLPSPLLSPGNLEAPSPSSSPSTSTSSPLSLSKLPIVDVTPRKKHLLSLRSLLLKENEAQLHLLQHLHESESHLNSRIEELQTELALEFLPGVLPSPNIRWPTSSFVFAFLAPVSSSDLSLEAKFVSDAFYDIFHLDADLYRRPMAESVFRQNHWSKKPEGIATIQTHKAMLTQSLQRGVSGISIPCSYRRTKAIASSTSSLAEDEYEDFELLPSWQILSPFPNLQVLVFLIPK